MTDTAIVPAVQAGLMPALTMNEAKARYNALVEFTKSLMKEGKDYGIIPGTGNKPTLLKPGAEKLCSLFGLVPDFEIVDRIVDFDAGLFYYHYKCLLSRDGHLVATGEGSANSREKKYRWRNVPEWKATEEEKAAAVRVETKSNNRGQYKIFVIENSEPFDLINTLQKMAQKRALVAATLIAANASEFFTQDIEDLEFVDAEFTEVPPQPRQPEEVITELGYAPAPEKPKARKGKANGKNERPYTVPQLIDALAKMVDKVQAEGWTPKEHDRNMVAVNLEACFADADAEHKRKAVLNYLFMETSTKDLTDEQIVALKMWLKARPDEGGEWHPDPLSVKEAQAVYTEALKAEGQQELPV